MNSVKYIHSKIDEEGQSFQIRDMVEQCNPEMLPRELTMNGIEAGATEIHWDRDIRGITCTDNGDGIPLKHLSKLLDFSSVTGKDRGATGNKGIGARITGLFNSPDGVKYETCRKDEGSHMTEVKRLDDGFYGGRQYPNSLSYQPCDYDIPGTRVTLRGGGPKTSGFDINRQGRLPEALYYRFFRLPENVSVTVARSLHSGKQAKTLIPQADMINDSGWQQESVKAADGIIIHYIDSRAFMRMSKGKAKDELPVGPVASARPTSAIVYRDEMYCPAWLANDRKRFMRSIGLSELTRELMVFIEIPDDFPVRANTDRTQLLWDHASEKRKVRTANTPMDSSHFIEDVRANIPDWVEEMIQQKRTKANKDEMEQETEKLRSHLRELFAPIPQPVKRKDGDIVGFDDGDVVVGIGEGKGNKRRRKKVVRENDDGDSRAKLIKAMIAEMDVEVIADLPDDCEIRGNKVLVSGQHPFFKRALARLKANPELESLHEDLIAVRFYEVLEIKCKVPVGVAAADAKLRQREDGNDHSEIPIGAFMFVYYEAYDDALKALIAEC